MWCLAEVELDIQQVIMTNVGCLLVELTIHVISSSCSVCNEDLV